MESSHSAKPLLHVAPMLEVTSPDFRYLLRLLTRQTTLWTAMIGPSEQEDCIRDSEIGAKYFSLDSASVPVVHQLGGNDPVLLSQSAALAERHGCREVNLNCGCPSSKVSGNGDFGVSLMRRKELVRDIVHTMSRVVQIPISVKCRLGVDELDSPEFISDFVRTVAQGGCKHFAIHARKADLSLSAQQNRSVPPLDYSRVADLCLEFPDITFTLNGGISGIYHARTLLGLNDGEKTDLKSDDAVAVAWGRGGIGTPWCGVPSNLGGVMIGTAVRNDPVILWKADRTIFGDSSRPLCGNRRDVLEQYCKYLEDKYSSSPFRAPTCIPSSTIKLFTGARGLRLYKTTLLGVSHKKECTEIGPAHVLRETMKELDGHNTTVLDQPLRGSEVECLHCGYNQNRSHYKCCYACREPLMLAQETHGDLDI